jgi:hypothetical protein
VSPPFLFAARIGAGAFDGTMHLLVDVSRLPSSKGHIVEHVYKLMQDMSVVIQRAYNTFATA